MRKHYNDNLNLYANTDNFLFGSAK